MRILVLGGGYAGLALTRRLETQLPADVELLLVDENGEHLVQHELHRVVRRPSLADDIAVPLSEAVERASVREERVTGIDRDERTVSLADGSALSYDVAAICLGATTNFYELPGVEERSTPLKQLSHARSIRAGFLDVCKRDGTAVVGGAGLSGIQVAGELAALAREEADGTVSTVDVVLLEQESAVAPGFPEPFRDAVREELLARGVDVRAGNTVRAATDEAVRLADGSAIQYDQLVWTGGITGTPAMGGELPVVRRDLALDDRTFVVGDAARAIDADGAAVPASAQAAIREAKTVARTIERIVEHEREGGVFDPRPEPFSFDSPGWLVSVGDGTVGLVGGNVVRGAAALAIKTTVGAGYLSSVGAVRNAVELVNEELGLGAD